MTNLANKFSSFEGQLSSQHAEVMTALNTIAFALGAPPTTPATNLDDIYTQLTALINGLALIYSSNNTFHASLLSVTGQINTNTDTLINNSSLNAQRMIAAILSTACPCGTTTTPLLAPPLDATPTPVVNDAKCRRIQFYLAVFGTWLFDIANYGSTGAAITGDVLGLLAVQAGVAFGMATTGAEAGAIFGIPGAVVGAVVGAIIAAVYFLGGTQLVNWANDFNSPIVQSALLSALYAANSADEGQTAFQSVVNANFSGIPAGIINALWWSGWSNDLYSDTPVVDDSAFDGSICVEAPSGCYTITSSVVTANVGAGDVLEVAVTWPDAFTPTALRPDGARVWSTNVFARLASGTQITIRRTTAYGGGYVYLYYPDGTVASLSPTSTAVQTYDIPVAGTGLTIQAGSSGAEWIAEFEVCFVE